VTPLGPDNDPVFHVVPDEDLSPEQLRQVEALRAEIANTKPADAVCQSDEEE
jgi:hypothetical protein